MKAVWKNLFLFSALAFVAFFSCDQRTDEEKWEAQIRGFIYEYKDEVQSYVPLRYQKIDLAFLENQEVIKDALLVLQDTTRQRVRQLHLANLSDQVENISAFSEPFHLDKIDDYLKLRASAEGRLSRKQKPHSETYQQALALEQSALDNLESLLSQFNLSIYSIDFEDDPVIYLHEYRMNDEDRSAVFELDRESSEILSFKELGVV
ncbi:MAG: hypothetical protein HWE07_04800 [Cytophagia bacterium]|nr:hypothetical protein [Cytophagia bacterium]